MATSGTLKVHIIEAKLERDTEAIGKMDPYCIVNMRMQRIRTKTAMDEGKQPTWDNEKFDLDVKYIGDDMHLEVFDEDPCDSDLVGSANIKLSAMCMNGGFDEWYEIQFKGRRAGAVHIKGEWHPRGEMLVAVPIGQ